MRMLYEANARVLLRRLSARHGRTLTLGAVPYEEWAELARKGFDALWLMGAWRRSPGARAEALRAPELRRAYSEALPDWTEEDVDGSPYAVAEYRLDPALGADGELDELRARLDRAGLKLLLDFVPNHLARDHAWTASHPERFVRGPAPGAPDAWFFESASGARLAHGRDPNFPPWSDTAQLDFFSESAREALIAELARIAASCDGVRCDMAMLALSSVFERVWGGVVGRARPRTEFWAEAISRIRSRHPLFVFLAESYWGAEWDLQELGFDFTYDKTLYDRLRHGGASRVLEHLRPNGPFQRRSAHFVENHDEPRAAAIFGPERADAAAAVCATIPGLPFFHDGQLEGRRVRLPIQLGREPAEAPDLRVQRFYERLLEAAREEPFRTGDWTLLEPRPERDGSCRGVLAWTRRSARRSALVAVNYSPSPARAIVDAAAPGPDVFGGPSPEPAAEGWLFTLAPWEVRLHLTSR